MSGLNRPGFSGGPTAMGEWRQHRGSTCGSCVIVGRRWRSRPRSTIRIWRSMRRPRASASGAGSTRRIARLMQASRDRAGGWDSSRQVSRRRDRQVSDHNPPSVGHCARRSCVAMSRVYRAYRCGRWRMAHAVMSSSRRESRTESTSAGSCWVSVPVQRRCALCASRARPASMPSSRRSIKPSV